MQQDPDTESAWPRRGGGCRHTGTYRKPCGDTARQHRGRHVLPATHTTALWFQCVKEVCALLQSRALLLPSLKLLLESQDERLQALALEHLTAVAKVSPAGSALLVFPRNG